MPRKAEVRERQQVLPAVIRQAAGLGTLAAIPAPSPDKRRKQALPRMRDAERAVQENFDFERRLFHHTANIGERKLPRHDGARHTERGGKTHARAVMERHLRRGVKFQPRDSLPHLADQTDVRDDHGVDPHAVEVGTIGERLFPLAVVNQHVDGHVHPQAI